MSVANELADILECRLAENNLRIVVGGRMARAIIDTLRNRGESDAVKPGWISVEERLPEDLLENQGRKVIPCLVSLASVYPNGKPITQKRQRQLQYYGSAGWVWEWSRIGSSRVTHWMPLPEPPMEG